MDLIPRLREFRTSFRYHLFVRFTLLTAALIIAFTSFYVSHEISSHRRQLQREARLLAEQLALNARLPLFAENRTALYELLEETVHHYPISLVAITNTAGKLMASAESGRIITPKDDIEQIVPVMADTTGSVSETLMGGESAEKRQIGQVRLLLETRDLHAQIRSLVATSVTMGIVFWLLVSVFGYLLLRRVTASFNQLMEGLRVIAEGHLRYVIPTQGNDEPAQAAAAVNALTKALNLREAENRRLQEERDQALRTEVQEEKKRIMARLIQTNKMTSLGLLVSSMAHEINNPNATINLSAHYLWLAWKDILPRLEQAAEAEGPFPLGNIPFETGKEEFGGCIDTIRASSQRIDRVIHDLRSYGLGMKSGFEPGVDLNRMITSALTIVRCYNQSPLAELESSLDEEIPTVFGSQPQLEQVVVNLLTNALQALPDNRGRVSIVTGASADRREVLITVQDSGKGIPSEVRERLFEPFFSTRIEQGGSGLGLYIANFIVGEHGGRLDLDSEEGKGTTAVIRLPAETR